jgi:hypothetical protein
MAKRKLKPIKGLTYKQKLAMEAVMEYGIELAERCENDLPVELQTFAKPFKKVLAIFRQKTKHMKPPRRRRKQQPKRYNKGCVL